MLREKKINHPQLIQATTIDKNLPRLSSLPSASSTGPTSSPFGELMGGAGSFGEADVNGCNMHLKWHDASSLSKG